MGERRGAVRTELGTPNLPSEEVMAGSQWHYYVGEVNGFMGPGDAGYLFVRFGSDGRANLISSP